MAYRDLDVLETMALSHLNLTSNPPISLESWVRILRTRLRMTQAELAERAKLPQSHIARIESGKGGVQIGTLKKIFNALSCDMAILPQPRKSLEDILRGRARSVALKRLKQSAGTMALEGQGPEAELFRQVLEKKTDEILNDRRERLWNKKDD